MHTVLYIVCGVLCFGVVLWGFVHFGWAIATQDRDHGNRAEGPFLRRRISSTRRPPARAGMVNPEAYSDQPVSPEGSSRSARVTGD